MFLTLSRFSGVNRSSPHHRSQYPSDQSGASEPGDNRVRSAKLLSSADCFPRLASSQTLLTLDFTVALIMCSAEARLVGIPGRCIQATSLSSSFVCSSFGCQRGQGSIAVNWPIILPPLKKIIKLMNSLEVRLNRSLVVKTLVIEIHSIPDDDSLAGSKTSESSTIKTWCVPEG